MSVANFAQVADDFSDGDFTVSPVWQGNSGSFIVNSSGQLQLSSTGAGQSYLSTSFGTTTLANKEWRMWIKQAFSGSDANQSRIYLSNAGSVLNYTGSGSCGSAGYFLKLGEAGSADVVRFYKDTGTGISLIASGNVSIASSFTIRIKVSLDNAGNWTFSIDSSGGENFVEDFTANDNSISNSSNFGLSCTYTSSNAAAFYFDDIYFGAPIVDTTPPIIVSATAISATDLDVLFSESVSSNAANTAYYNVLGIGNPASANIDGSNSALVHLSFGAGFNANINSTLNVTNVSDLAGNAIVLETANFVWSAPVEVGFRDIVFNEVFADPTPTVGLPQTEFIELYNRSAQSIPLGGMQLVNTTSPKTLPEYLLGPNEYVVLCEDDSVAAFGISNIIGISSFVALTNAGDSLTLLDVSGNVIDIVVYSDDWYATTSKRDGGWSLELKNPGIDCQSGANWSESSSVTGGTPGIVNSVFSNSPDSNPPTLVGFSLQDNQTLIIHLNEAMNTGLDLGSSFTITPNLSIAQLEWTADLQSLIIHFSSAVVEEVYYQITYTGLEDCSGNIMNSGNFSFVQGRQPQLGEIIINEIMADPNPSIGSPPGEYIEVFNKTDHLIDLTGLKVNNGYFNEQVLLQPDSFIVITDEDNFLFFLAIPNIAFMTSFPGLTDSGIEVRLELEDGTVIDAVNYTSDWYRDADKDAGGYSLELINPEDPCSDADNWRASNSTNGGTAGKKNSVYDNTPDTTAPSLLYVFTEPAESITLVFNEPIDENSLQTLSWLVNGVEQNGFDATLSSSASNEVVLHYGTMTAGVVYGFQLTGLEDCWGNSASAIEGAFALPETYEAGDLIINEILFNAPDGGRDFVEIYNKSLRNISIKGWTIADNYAGAMNTPDTICTRELILFPGEYLILTRDDGSLKTLYPNTRSERIWDVPGLSDFGSSEDIVYLIAPGSAMSDELSYTVDMQFPLIDNPDGVSLERINFDRPTSDKTNWHSASESVGFATPGYLNSQAFAGGLTSEEFSGLPEVFSPDNDGYQDVVTFSYKMDAPGYVGNIKIFDSEGRQIRHLMKNELLGNNGSISWDGFSDDRQLAHVGIYVVYFEVFSTNGTTKGIKIPTVVAQKLN